MAEEGLFIASATWRVQNKSHTYLKSRSAKFARYQAKAVKAMYSHMQGQKRESDGMWGIDGSHAPLQQGKTT